MQLEEGGELVATGAARPAIADFFERRAEALAVAILARMGKVALKAPAKTPEAIIGGEKREPSSLVQLITSIGAKVW